MRFIQSSIVSILVTGHVLAQPPALPTAIPVVLPQTPKPAETEVDPTVPSPRIKELLNKTPETRVASKMPTIALKGRVLGKDRAPIVILEIDSKIYTVTQGVNIVIASNQILKIVEITSKEVRVQLDGAESFTIN